MNDEQQSVAWLAVFLILITVWLTYRNQLSEILFGKPASGWSVTDYSAPMTNAPTTSISGDLLPGIGGGFNIPLQTPPPTPSTRSIFFNPSGPIVHTAPLDLNGSSTVYLNPNPNPSSFQLN